MRAITKRRINESVLSRSCAGYPDVKHIGCEELAASITRFCKEHLRGLAEVIGPKESMRGIIGISPTLLGMALRVTVDNLSVSAPVKIGIIDWHDELSIQLEAAELEDLAVAAKVTDAWQEAGFRIKHYGFALVMTIPFDEALDFVLRQHPDLFDYRLQRGYFTE